MTRRFYVGSVLVGVAIVAIMAFRSQAHSLLELLDLSVIDLELAGARQKEHPCLATVALLDQPPSCPDEASMFDAVEDRDLEGALLGPGESRMPKPAALDRRNDWEDTDRMDFIAARFGRRAAYTDVRATCVSFWLGFSRIQGAKAGFEVEGMRLRNRLTTITEGRRHEELLRLWRHTKTRIEALRSIEAWIGVMGLMETECDGVGRADVVATRVQRLLGRRETIELRRSLREAPLDQGSTFPEVARALHSEELALEEALDTLAASLEEFPASIANLRANQNELSLYAKALLRGSRSTRARIGAMLEAEPTVEIAAARARAIALLNQSAQGCFESPEQARAVRECRDHFDGIASRWERYLRELRELRTHLGRSLLPNTPRAPWP